MQASKIEGSLVYVSVTWKIITTKREMVWETGKLKRKKKRETRLISPIVVHSASPSSIFQPPKIQEPKEIKNNPRSHKNYKNPSKESLQPLLLHMTGHHLFDQVTETCLNDPSANYVKGFIFKYRKANASGFTNTAFKANSIHSPKFSRKNK